MAGKKVIDITKRRAALQFPPIPEEIKIKSLEPILEALELLEGKPAYYAIGLSNYVKNFMASYWRTYAGEIAIPQWVKETLEKEQRQRAEALEKVKAKEVNVKDKALQVLITRAHK